MRVPSFFKTLFISNKHFSTSVTCSITSLRTTASNELSLNGKLNTSPLIYRSFFDCLDFNSSGKGFKSIPTTLYPSFESK